MKFASFPISLLFWGPLNMKKNKKTTIKDVAKAAFVSPSTVSRVISGSTRISKETTERVKDEMKKLGYHPNAIARSLASNTSHTLGIIMPNRPGEVLLNPFFPEVLSGILKVATREGYDVLLCSQSEKQNEIKIVESLINASKVDGVLLMAREVGDCTIKYLKEIDFPYSVIGSPAFDEDDKNYVDNDNEKASFELTNYLIKKGYKKIALIGGDNNLTVTKKRVAGFLKALNDSLLSRQSRIPITSVDVHADKLGEEAVDMLIKIIKTGKNQVKRRVEYTIYKRESTE
jgi:DNA-binding LacI/PurR family transcriptional regulator